MLLLINKNYFAWDPDRIADVIVSLDSAKAFIAYPGFTRVESNGQTASLMLDGRTSFLPNRELSALLVNVQKELAAADGANAPPDSSPSPSL